MKRVLSLVALALALTAAAGVAKADSLVFTTTLAGTNEVPANASPGIGTAVITIDTATHMMTVNVTFSGLLGNTTASHIHCCGAVGTNAQVATTTPTFTGFPLGVQSGTYLHTFDLTLASSYNPAFITSHGGTVTQAEADLIAGLLAGQAYLNIHTNLFPGGEIRGQLAPVPEPATVLLLVSGMAGLALRRRKARPS